MPVLELTNEQVFDLVRQMPPEQRQQVLDSPRFRSMFSPQEREMLKNVTQLPIAAPENDSENH